MLKRVATYWRAAKGESVAGGAILVGAACVDLLQPWPIKWLVDYVFGDRPAPAWLTKIWPVLATNNLAGGITAVCLSILILAVVYRCGVTLGHFFLVRAGARVVQRLRCHAYEHLHRLSISYHDKTKVGDSLYRVAYDSHAAQSLINGAIVPMANGALMLFGAIIIMLQMNVVLTLTTLAAAPLFVLIIRGFSKTIDGQSRRYHESESALVSAVQEALSCIRAIQAFTLEPQTSEQFYSHSRESLKANEKMTRTQLLYSACAGLAVALGTAGVVWVAGHQVLAGKISLGDILVFLAYLGMLYQPMNTFSQSASVIQSASAQLKRVFEIIDAVPEIQEKPQARALPQVRGAVAFKDVVFGYEPDRPVLKGISLQVEPGQIIALVGRTGAGKTTMASLLLRFYDPISGAIHLDGHDLRDLKLDWVRRQVSVVLQDPILFSTTIAENIAYGLPGATPEQIRTAAFRAQADEFIQRLPQGYDTIIGERGVNLSGGQRQRLSIARAFLKNAPILVLDEPTSALDVHTEEALLVALKELMRGRTTFVIAHRLSTVRQADSVVVLENGKIVEQGSHAELVARGSVYSSMYRLQHREQPEGSLEVALS